MKRPLSTIHPSSIHKVIGRSFVLSLFAVFLVLLGSALYLNQRAIHLVRENNLTKAHETLGHLLAPAVSIGDSGEIRRLLGLSSDQNEFFAVIDGSNNILLPDYKNMQLVQTFFQNNKLLADCKKMQVSYQEIKGQHYWVSCSALTNHDLLSNSKNLGMLVSLTKDNGFSVVSSMRYFFAVGAIILILLFIWFRQILQRRLLKPLVALGKQINDKAKEPLTTAPSIDEVDEAPDEVQNIKQAFEQLLKNLQSEYQYRVESEKKVILGELATQVSHDIKSPLAALDMVVSDLAKLPEEKRILVRSAVNRIKDIANNLLQKNREVSQEKKAVVQFANNDSAEPKSAQLLLSLIDSIVSEKRAQFLTKPGIDILFNNTAAAYGLFAEIQPIEFKRAISNLINNAVEVLKDTGQVELTLTLQDQMIELRIADNGPGIPPEILRKLGQRGETHGKTEGSGLGLFHAQTMCHTAGGTLDIESTVGKGTVIILRLPKVASPHWFVPELKLSKNSTVFILDDDPSIKEIWRQRLKLLSIDTHAIQVNYFSTMREFETAVQALDHTQSITYLVDYEIIGEQRVGLDLVAHLDIGAQSILVSSRWDEPEIQARCQQLGVRLIPKGSAAFVPLSIQAARACYDWVLLDDDNLVITTWEMLAKQYSKRFISFRDPAAFFEALTDIDRRSPIFIDANLGKGIKGQDLVPKVKTLGFEKIYLATGYEADTFGDIPGLTAVVGKEPLIEVSCNVKGKLQNISSLALSVPVIESQDVVVKFASRIAHDLRSPIAILDMNVNSLANNIPPEQADVLRSVIQRLRDLTNDLSETENFLNY